MTDAHRRDTGSAELDRIIGERARIRAEWFRPRIQVVQIPTAPPVPIFPPLPEYNVKPVDERIAEADKFLGELPKAVVKEIKDCILKSASEFGESCSLDVPRECEYPEVIWPSYTTVTDIQNVVAEHFCLTRDQIMSSRRAVFITRPRQIAMYLAKNLTKRSYPDIARRFGGRDHTTVIHAMRRVERLIVESWWAAEEIKMLSRKLSRE